MGSRYPKKVPKLAAQNQTFSFVHFFGSSALEAGINLLFAALEPRCQAKHRTAKGKDLQDHAFGSIIDHASVQNNLMISFLFIMVFLHSLIISLSPIQFLHPIPCLPLSHVKVYYQCENDISANVYTANSTDRIEGESGHGRDSLHCPIFNKSFLDSIIWIWISLQAVPILYAKT
jgi:hypothetical protein